jgi:hypothetical protein
MKLIFLLSAIVCLGWAGCSQKQEKEPAATNEPSSSSGNPLTAPVDYIGAVGRAQQSAGKVASTVGIQQAIQMFYTQEGRYPKNLNELVGGDYLPRLPSPPAGMKYDYNPTNGQVRVVRQ